MYPKIFRLISLSMFIIHLAGAATPGLPFTEDFSSDNLIEKTKTTANVDTEEQAVRLAWAKRRYGALVDPPVITISNDQDETNAIAIGDVDGDGDLDVVAGNEGVNKLYLNTGVSRAPFDDSLGILITDDVDYTRSIALGDLDNDGDLDVVVGNGSRNRADGAPNRLYLNNGTENPFINTVGLTITDDTDNTVSIAIGDVDSDGDLDILAGNDGVNKLYLNTGVSTAPFADSVGIPITDNVDLTNSIVLGDLDNDGDLDVVVGNGGQNNFSGPPNRLLLNNGTANPFANVEGANISDDTNDTLSIALGDIDSDGDLDVVAGNSNPNRLYLNNGTSTPFTNVEGVNISDDGDKTRSIALGDVDGDGDLDVVAGNDFDPNRLFLNNGTTKPFANVEGVNITDDNHRTFSIALGDMSGDGDLDLIVGNVIGLGGENRLYLNHGTNNPFVNVEGVDIDALHDFTHSIALGDVDGDGDLDVVAGNGSLFDQSNRLFLNNGTSYPFANVEGVNISDDSDGTRSIALGDVDGDGDLDIVAGNDSTDPNRLYLNNGTANPFANVEGVNITNDSDRTISIALGDVDGDGDLDVVAGNYRAPDRLFLNNGTSNPFAGVDGISITDDSDQTFSIVLGDLDGDGDLDVVTGNEDAPHRLYLNNGTSNPFTNVNGVNISEDSDFTLSIAMGDIDGDGDLDVVAGNFSQPNRLYLNNGTASPFANVEGVNITDHEDITESIALGDMNGDGSLDIVVANQLENVFYLNNGTGNPFANVQSMKLTSDSNSTVSTSLALGDVDSDGDLDVVSGNLDFPNHVYLNNGASNPFSAADACPSPMIAIPLCQ